MVGPLELLLAVQLVGLAAVLALLALAWPRRTKLLPAARAHHAPSMPALPDGHDWPDVCDSFDGVHQRWVCRDPACQAVHLRRWVAP